MKKPVSAMTGQAGNQHPVFYIDMKPLLFCKAKCEEAGLSLQGVTRQGGKVTHTWKGEGPYTAYKFCQTHRRKQYGQGSGALAAPAKDQDASTVLTKLRHLCFDYLT